MWVVADQADPPAVAAAAQEASQEAAAPTVLPAWEEEEEAAALEDRGATPPPCVALAPDPLASHSLLHASPSLSTTTIPRVPKGPTDQQVCGHPATRSPLSPSPQTPIQRTRQMESC